jgi:hypothetical protein
MIVNDKSEGMWRQQLWYTGTLRRHPSTFLEYLGKTEKSSTTTDVPRMGFESGKFTSEIRVKLVTAVPTRSVQNARLDAHLHAFEHFHGIVSKHYPIFKT